MIAQRIIVFLGIVLSVLTAGLGSARADSVGKIETSYEVNVRGITVLDIKYTSEIFRLRLSLPGIDRNPGRCCDLFRLPHEDGGFRSAGGWPD